MRPGISMKSSEVFRSVFFFSLIFSFLFIGRAANATGLDNDAGGGLTFTLSDYNGFNVSCNGAADGTIDLTPSGVAPFNFQWSNGASSEDLSGLTAGTYTVTVTDDIGAIQTAAVTLTEPTDVSATLASLQDVTCNGAGDGFININVSGGVPGYAYLWSNAETTQNISGLSGGNYTVTVTDLNNCTEVFTQAIAEPAVLVVSTVNVTDVSCFSGNNGAIDINVTGGTTTYTFLWSNAETTQNINTLIAGFYTVTVTDQNSCTAQLTEEVVQPAAVSVTLGSVQDVSCNAGNNGAITINVAGGTPGYTFLWSNAETTQNISGLTANTYTVTVSDLNSCTAQLTQSVSEPVALSVTLGSVQDVSCNAGNNGAIIINVAGGTPGYTFLWSNAETTQNISGLTANTYTVTVSDLNSCTAQLTQAVSQPSAVNVTLGFVQDVSCNAGNNGAITINVSGGTPGYSYLWSNAETTQNISGLTANTYTVTVSDLNSCTAQFTQAVSQPAQALSATTSTTPASCITNNGSATVFPSGGTPGYTYLWNTGGVSSVINGLAIGTYTVTVTDLNSCTFQAIAQVNPSVSPVISNAVVTDVNCNGAATGAIDITVTGGTIPISYQWSNGQTTEDISGLLAGTYTVTVTDAASCTATATYNVNTLGSAINLSFNSTQPGCLFPNGSITVNASGGTPNYTYLWSNSQTTQTINGLSAGAYTVTVTDALGCTADSAFSLSSSFGPTITLNSITDVTCNGGSNGAIDVTISGGTFPLGIQWSNGAITSDLSGVPANVYTITVTDLFSCVATASYTINQPPPFTVTPTVTPETCGLSNGMASVFVTGDNPPYSYLWSTGSTASSISALPGGAYTVTVTGTLGCTSVQTLNVPGGTALQVSIDSVKHVDCFSVNSGAIYITASGSATPYQYFWNDASLAEDRTGLSAGTYTVTVTGNDGCTSTASATVNPPPTIILSMSMVPANCGQANGSASVTPLSGNPPFTYLWSNGGNTPSIVNVASAVYSVTVTSVEGCTRIDSIMVLNAGAPVANLVQLTLPPCDGSATGSIEVNATGGLPSYTYLWSNGETVSQISNLGFGFYTVTITDANSCSVVATYDLGSQLQVSLQSQQNNICPGTSLGAIDINVSGGLPVYTFLWSDTQTTEDIQNLPAGTYTVTVTDQNSCTAQLSAVISAPSAIVINGFVSDVTCASNNGGITLNVTGGTSPYTYLWSTSETTADIFNLSANAYTVTVTDNFGCTAQNTFNVNSITTLSASFQLIQGISCSGASDATISVFAFGGTPGYSYLWSNGSTSQLLSAVPAGIYTVTVTDDAGCQSLFNDTIEEPLPLAFTFNITHPSCGLSNGVITVQATGGTPAYNYLWSSGSSASTISGVPAGAYSLTITDDKGCQRDTLFNLLNTGLIQVSSVVDSVSCNGLSDGAIDLTVSGGAIPYGFVWVNTPQTTEDVTGLAAGNYSVIVTDFSGCTASQSFTLLQPDPITISFPLLQNAACGNANGGVIANANGTYLPFSYLWSTGVQNPGLFNIAAGTYTVTVTDTKGCTNSDIVSVSNVTGPVFNSVDSGNVTCYGGNNGFININVSGASPPFTYSWTGSAASTPSISDLTAGIYTLQVTDAQNCISVRSVTITQPDSIRINPIVPQHNPPYNINCFGSNDGQIFLSVNGGVPPFTYVWSNGATSQNVDSLVAGAYTVIVTDQAGCTAQASFNLTQPPQLVANAGQDVTICGTTSFVMQATTPTIGFGYWTAITHPGVNTFSDSTSSNATVFNLQEGDNVFLWTVTLGNCSTSVQVTITRGTSITASAGTDLVICESIVTLNATNPQFGFGFWTTFSPGVTIDNPSSAITQASNLLLGNNIFRWTVISGTCRDSAEINIFRNDSLDCLSVIRIPTAFSPNNDGYNDAFVIKGLADFPDNNLTIFNRWGVVVYETDNYQNNWDGFGPNNEPLNDGTYFVLLRVRSIDKVFNSYLDLRR